jgi:hypothetical protein
MTKPEHPRSPHWPAARAAWLSMHDRCVHCGTDAALEVHHICPVHLFPAMELQSSNFMTLCEGPNRCHLVFGHLGDWHKWNTALLPRPSVPSALTPAAPSP